MQVTKQALSHVLPASFAGVIFCLCVGVHSNMQRFGVCSLCFYPLDDDSFRVNEIYKKKHKFHVIWSSIAAIDLA